MLRWIAVGVSLVLASASWAIAPYPSAPECPPEAHNVTTYHSLWNEALGCHYDHEHGEPYPAWAQQIWGDYTVETGGGISYPWQTPNENLLKHEGYKLFHKDLRNGYPYTNAYPSADPCPPFPEPQDITPGGPSYTIRVVAYSVQTHNLAHAHEAMTRKHSYFAQLLVCDPATDQFGTIVTGGHADYGQRVSGYQGPLVNLADQPTPAYNVQREPYLAHPCADAACGNWAFRQNKKFANASTWTNEPIYVTGANKIVNFGFRIRNVIDGIEDRFGAPDGNYLCTQDGGHTFHQPGCYSVGTQHNFFEVRGFGAPASLAVNGVVNYVGFTDLNGNVSSTCTEASSVCVPLRITNVRVGSLMGDDNEKAFGFKAFDKPLFTERNICFNGTVQASCETATPAGWIGEMN